MTPMLTAMLIPTGLIATSMMMATSTATTRVEQLELRGPGKVSFTVDS